MPLRRIGKRKRGQKVFVEGMGPGRHVYLLALAGAAVERGGSRGAVRPFHVLFEPRSAQMGPALSRHRTCLSCSWPHTSVSESEWVDRTAS